MTGAALMKLGRAPMTWSSGWDIAGEYARGTLTYPWTHHAGASIGGAPPPRPSCRRPPESAIPRRGASRHRTGPCGRPRPADDPRDLDVRCREPVPDPALA